jgi:hypothetical protein
MRVRLAVIVFLISLGCVERPKCDFIAEFNDQAKRAFEPKAHLLVPELSDFEKCVFETVIKRDLNYLNDWKLSIVDSLLIRSYYINEINFGFSFAATMDGDFYFLAIPKLHNYLTTDTAYKEINGEFKLHKPTSAISRIDTRDTRELLNAHVFAKNVDHFEKHIKALRIIHQAFPGYFENEIYSVDDFLRDLNNEPSENLKNIMSILDSKLKTPSFKKPVADFLHIYKYGKIGYLVLHFTVDIESTFEMYYIAKEVGIRLPKNERERYQDCISPVLVPAFQN